MSFNPTSPVTGAAISGLTSPTYTITEDQAPDGDTRRFLVTALGGTQTGVETHTVSSPFACHVSRPKTIRTLGRINPATGFYMALPVNEFRRRIYKGVTIVNGAISQEAVCVDDRRSRIVAGSELSGNDVEDLKAFASFAAGFDYSNAQWMYDLWTTGAIK